MTNKRISSSITLNRVIWIVKRIKKVILILWRDAPPWCYTMLQTWEVKNSVALRHYEYFILSTLLTIARRLGPCLVPLLPYSIVTPLLKTLVNWTFVEGLRDEVLVENWVRERENKPFLRCEKCKGAHGGWSLPQGCKSNAWLMLNRTEGVKDRRLLRPSIDKITFILTDHEL